MESHQVEYKRIWKDEYMKVLCAFANTTGGLLIIGVDDDGNPVGLEKPNKLLEDLPNKIINTLAIYPEIELFTRVNQYLIEIKIKKSTTPIFYHSKFYKRVGATNQELTGKELSREILELGDITWDEFVIDNATLNDIDFDTVRYFQEKAKLKNPAIDEEKEVADVLKALKLFSGDKLKRAAILLFGKDPASFYTAAYTKIGRFISDSEVITDDLIEGNLFQQLERTIDVLRTKYFKTKISYDGIHRKDVLEYPIGAIREAYINALIHKEYIGTHIQIKVYDNAFQIWNNGLLPKGLSAEQLTKKHSSIPRNDLCAKTFFLAGFIEAWGKGTNNIIKNCADSGLLPPEFKEEFGGLTVIFKQKENFFNQDFSKDFESFNDRQKVLIEQIANGLKEITTRAYLKMVDTSERTGRYDLNDLVEKGILSRVGAGAATKYEVVEQQP